MAVERETYMSKNVESDKTAGKMEDELRPDGDQRSIWEAIDDIIRHVPEEVLSRVPVDGAERHDHYLSGTHEKASREP
jgi:hypothetical protein